MKIAIEEMKLSENKGDGKGRVDPLVGAVLVSKEGHIIDKAHRGELRIGDHAEYTLLERKNRDKDMTGSTLYVTLEPCSPGARNHPKLSCAERIVLARSREVYIGIVDPDPSVEGKGKTYLEEHDIKVHFFPKDLEDIIRKENKNFIAQCLEKAKTLKEKKGKEKTILEKTTKDYNFNNFSIDALELFREKANIKYKVDSQDFKNLIKQMNFLEIDKKTLNPTGLGLLLFGENPQQKFHNSILKAEIIFGNSRPEVEDIGGPLVLYPKKITSFLKKSFFSPMQRTYFERQTTPEYPIEIVEEAILNALIHRDYSIKGACTYLIINDDKIIVKSPGKPISPNTIKDLNDFNATSICRNPKIMYVFNQMEYAEQRGFGLRKIKKITEDRDLPLPIFSYEEPNLIITFIRSSIVLKDYLDEHIVNQLNDDEKTGVLYILNKKILARNDYEKHFDFNKKKAERHLNKFIELGFVKRIGLGPSTKYELNVAEKK